MSNIDTYLGLMIRDGREKVGMTQLELSMRLGYEAPQFISIVERGLAKVPLRTLGELIVILGLPEKRILRYLIRNFEKELKRELQLGKRKALQLKTQKRH